MLFMTGDWLASLKVRALRRRSWYSLSRLERSVVDLTIRYVDRIESERLSLVISRIVCKILKAMRSPFLQRAEQMGYGLAERFSRIAVSWGYAEASNWRRDLGFVRYLGANAVSNNSGWGQV